MMGMLSDKTMTDILTQLETNPTTQSIVAALIPYLPAIKREGIEFLNELLQGIIKGEWSKVDELAWKKMTDDERDNLSATILKDARDTVDKQYARNELMKELALKIVSTMLLSLI